MGNGHFTSTATAFQTPAEQVNGVFNDDEEDIVQMLNGKQPSASDALKQISAANAQAPAAATVNTQAGDVQAKNMQAGNLQVPSAAGNAHETMALPSKTSAAKDVGGMQAIAAAVGANASDGETLKQASTASSATGAEVQDAAAATENDANSAWGHAVGFAGGYYIGLRSVLDKVPGVISTQLGFMGGPPKEHPTYDQVDGLNAKHPAQPWVETVQVNYKDDPGVLEALGNAFKNFDDRTNVGGRYSRMVFGAQDQLDQLKETGALSGGRGARTMESSKTHFEKSDRAYPVHGQDID